jgi:Fur family peroxide stress response transcriptional regulator
MLADKDRNHLKHALEAIGLRPTRQREHIYSVILQKRDHPTADELFARAKEEMPTISLATVYNCLETLLEANLVRQVNLERGPSRFCPNQSQHAHFHCRKTGKIFDIALPDNLDADLRSMLPKGFEAEHIELSYTGTTAAEESSAQRN